MAALSVLTMSLLLQLLHSVPLAAVLPMNSVAEPGHWRHTMQSIAGRTNSTPRAFCRGSSCSRMSKLLPLLQFKDPQRRVRCTCPQFESGECFAPGCFVCPKSCFTGALAPLARAGGPFGTGLLCSSGCFPCCQRSDDPDKVQNSTCDLVGTGCEVVTGVCSKQKHKVIDVTRTL